MRLVHIEFSESVKCTLDFGDSERKRMENVSVMLYVDNMSKWCFGYIGLNKMY